MDIIKSTIPSLTGISEQLSEEIWNSFGRG